jgi:hypothetical protein
MKKKENQNSMKLVEDFVSLLQKNTKLGCARELQRGEQLKQFG